MAGFVFAFGLFSGSGSAQWVVTDPGHTLGTALDMGQSAVEFGEQLSRWNRQVQEFQEALTQVASIIQNPSLIAANFTPDMSVVPEDRGADMQCPAPAGGGFSFDSPASLFSMLVPSASDDLVKKQWEICNQVVRLQNKKYNEIVRFVQASKDRQQHVTGLINSAKSDKSEGAFRSTQVKASGLMNDQLAEMQYVQARIQGFDATVARLERESNGYAKQMLNGKKSLIGQAVSLAALKTALEVAD
jgi:hypothetical protein